MFTYAVLSCFSISRFLCQNASVCNVVFVHVHRMSDNGGKENRLAVLHLQCNVQNLLGSLLRSPKVIIRKGLLAFGIAASRLRRFQFPYHHVLVGTRQPTPCLEIVIATLIGLSCTPSQLRGSLDVTAAGILYFIQITLSR